MAHGTQSGYQTGCRCESCREVHNVAAKAWYHANSPRILEQLAARYTPRPCPRCGEQPALRKAQVCEACKEVRAAEKRATARLREKERRTDPAVREAQRLHAQDYRRRFPEKVKAANQRERTRPGWLRNQYGLTEEQFEAMVVAQERACAICKRPSDSLHVDHDHDSGRVRGLLCGACNRALGLFGEDATRMLAAVEYLAQHSSEFAGVLKRHGFWRADPQEREFEQIAIQTVMPMLPQNGAAKREVAKT